MCFFCGEVEKYPRIISKLSSCTNTQNTIYDVLEHRYFSLHLTNECLRCVCDDSEVHFPVFAYFSLIIAMVVFMAPYLS